MKNLIQVATRELLDASAIAAQKNDGQLAAKFMSWSNNPTKNITGISAEAKTSSPWAGRMILAKAAIEA